MEAWAVPLQLTSGPLDLRTYTGAMALPFFYNQKRQTVQGCLYDSSGRIVPLSQRVSGIGGDRVINIDPPKLPSGTVAEVIIERESVYLGNLMTHYGHFLVESLSAFWALQRFPERQIVFHPFIFGNLIQSFMLPFFEAFKIRSTEIFIISEPTVFRKIIVPQRTFHLNQSVHREFAVLPRIVARRVAIKHGIFPLSGKRLFLSRARLPISSRSATNQLEVDQCMIELGFDVIHPQEMLIEDQIMAYSSSRCIAGFAGSALHNAIFAPTRSLVLEIGDKRSPHRMLPTQELCNLAGELDGRHIAFQSKGVEQADEIDIGYLKTRVLRELSNVPKF